VLSRRLIACLGATVVVAGCGSGDDTASERPAQTAADEPGMAMSAVEPAPRGPLLKLRDSQFGPVLFSGADRALYLFTRDARRKSRCYGECAVAWPPFYAKARPRAGKGVDASLLGTTKRRDGRRQVTYRGHPLYFYEHDPKGQVLCNDVVEFGGTWFALDAAGRPPA
jgi:predicted lipoprotein with Yx(FWY)xxD motif